MADEEKNFGIFSAIRTRNNAERAAKDCGNAFFLVAAIQGGIGAFIAPSLLFDAALFALCGYFVRFKQSRVASVVVLLLSMGAVATTVMNKMGQNTGGGNNIILAVMVVIAAIRAVEATFRLAGQFKGEESAAENT